MVGEYKVHENIPDHLHAQRMVLPCISYHLQKPYAGILLLIIPCPRRVDKFLVCSLHFPRRDRLEVRCHDLLCCTVQLFALFVEDDGVGVAVEDLKRQLGGVFVVNLCEGRGEDGP